MSQLGEKWQNGPMVGQVAERPSSEEVAPVARSSAAARWLAPAMAALPVGLYALDAVVLLASIGSHPGFTYNWENNTADGLFPFVANPGWDIFHLTQGLMTDSGATPLVVLPSWLGFLVSGESVGSMRWPVALIAAAAVPLLWLVGKRIIGTLPALLAAVLLALSPVYLVYSRTATNVGISLVPMLLTIYALLRLLERPRQWWWAVALLSTLVLGAYGYAPVRFLWPFSVGLMLLEAVLWKAQRKRLLVAAAFIVVSMAGIIIALDYDHGHDPIVSVGYYYSGRGEQVANLLVNESDYLNTVRGSNSQLPSPIQALGEMVGQNSSSLANLLLDRDTQPALTDYWNPHGRLIPIFLVPFFLLGFGRALWLARRRSAYQYHLLVLFFLGFTLPMIFTSQVHIGRLIFALPLLMLLIAIGIVNCGLWVANRGLLAARLDSRRRKLVLGALVVGLVGIVALSTWNDYNLDVPTTLQARITERLIADVGLVGKEGGRVALVDVDDPTLVLENIDANQYRLGLQNYYCFVNLSNNQSKSCSPSMPILIVGGLLARMQSPESIPGYCANIYYVAPALMDRFRAAAASHASMCPQPLKVQDLGD